MLAFFNLKTFAFEVDQCDAESPQERLFITSSQQENIETVICQQGKDILVMTETPVNRQHLLYAGLNFGMPWLLSAGVTYVQLINSKQIFHISSNLDGSLGGNGLSASFGKHLLGGPLFVGASTRAYKGLPGEWGTQIGPSFGISGGKKFLTGHITVDLMTGYDSRMGRIASSPELSMGLRIRLFKKKNSRD